MKNTIFALLKNTFMDWNSMSNAAIVQEIGKRLKEYRLKKKFTQQDIAGRSGISVFTVAQIEKGHPVSIAMLLPVLRVLRLLDNLELLLPEIGISPIELMKLKGKTPRRIRAKKQN
jgi:transcriptional regulator with XRE-family HTH domain